MKILNVWNSTAEKKVFYNVENPVFEIGDFKIYRQFYSCYLYTYKDISINQLAGLNKEHLTALFEDKRPEGQQGFLFDRAKDSLKKGLLILNN